MALTDRYTQVRMASGQSTDTVWVPEKHARVGAKLRIGDELWVVQETYATQTQEYVDQQRAFRIGLAECVH